VAIYKVATTAQQNNRTIHFILLIHCLAHLPFDHCIYSQQQYQLYAADKAGFYVRVFLVLRMPLSIPQPHLQQEATIVIVVLIFELDILVKWPFVSVSPSV
jgi:hypothetical protein